MAYPATDGIPRASRKGLTVTLWTLQVLLAAAFLAAGVTKLMGAPMMVAEFDAIGLGQWFRYLTGLLEVAGAVGLLLPRAIFYAAALLALVMCGALVAHLAVLGVSSALPALVLLVLSATIGYSRRPR